MTTTDEAKAEAMQRAFSGSRTDRIVTAITEAIIAAQRGEGKHASRAWIDIPDTLEALAEVAARIAFQAKMGVTAGGGRVFAEGHAEMIGQRLKALRKSRDKHPFAKGREYQGQRTAEGKEWSVGIKVALKRRKRI